MEDLYQSQIELQTLIKKVETNFKKHRKSLRTADYIKRRLSFLDMHWEKFYTNDEKLREFNNPHHAYFYKNMYNVTYSIYIKAREFIQNSKHPKPTMAKRPKPNPFNVQPMPKDQPVPVGGENQPESSSMSKRNNSKLDEMLHKQGSNFKALARTLANIKLDSVQEKWELEDILKSLDSRWTTIDTLHWEIDSELGGTDEYYENTFTKYENEYAAMKKQINSKLWTILHRENITPRLDIPVFDGNYEQWVSFKDLFTEAIHSNQSLSNAQKMQFLKSKVKDEPERLLQHLPISSDNYRTCWEILNHHYNNKRSMFTTHMNKFINFPVMLQATSGNIKQLHDITVESLNGIKNLGVNIDTWDPILVHLLQQKLDSETHNEYITALKQPRELPLLNEFLTFLEGKFIAMESAQCKQEAAVNQTSLNTPSAYTSNNQHKPSCFTPYCSTNKATPSMSSQEYPRKCPVCQQDHFIYFCTEFKDMAPVLKGVTITNLNLCSNCLDNHNSKPCYSTKRCQECSGYHNTLLHDVFHSQNESSINTSANQGNKSHVAQEREDSEQESNIHLATAIIKILGNDGVPHRMRALVDPGSKMCLITEKAAQQLRLPRQQFKGMITGLGVNDNICEGSLHLNCLSSDEKYSFYTEAFIMKTITENAPNITFPKPRWEILDALPLADSNFYVSNSVDILLGTEVYSSILKGGIFKDEISALVAQETHLGWIVREEGDARRPLAPRPRPSTALSIELFVL